MSPGPLTLTYFKIGDAVDDWFSEVKTFKGPVNSFTL
jgi:hypothetical protein